MLAEGGGNGCPDIVARLVDIAGMLVANARNEFGCGRRMIESYMEVGGFTDCV